MKPAEVRQRLRARLERDLDLLDREIFRLDQEIAMMEADRQNAARRVLLRARVAAARDEIAEELEFLGRVAP